MTYVQATVVCSKVINQLRDWSIYAILALTKMCVIAWQDIINISATIFFLFETKNIVWRFIYLYPLSKYGIMYFCKSLKNYNLIWVFVYRDVAYLVFQMEDLKK